MSIARRVLSGRAHTGRRAVGLAGLAPAKLLTFLFPLRAEGAAQMACGLRAVGEWVYPRDVRHKPYTTRETMRDARRRLLLQKRRRFRRSEQRGLRHECGRGRDMRF